MSLTLHVDGDRWRAHLRSVASAYGDALVPVAKGNGYGLGIGRLARKADWLGAPVIAVGTRHEVGDAASRFPGDIVVLGPWRPGQPVDEKLASRLIHTVSRVDDVAAFLAAHPHGRFVVELRTSLRRHGLLVDDLAALTTALHGISPRQYLGLAAHPRLGTGNAAELGLAISDAVAAGVPIGTAWLSHLTPEELQGLQARHPDIDFKVRIGTALWLGDRGALRPAATVLDVHDVRRGERLGYFHRRVPGGGHVVVVSGGTSQGIGLVAPVGDDRPRARLRAAAKGALEASGRLRSPYTWEGQGLRFIEPPHMHVSLLYVPAGVRVPAIGEEISLAVRFTATSFDQVVVS